MSDQDQIAAALLAARRLTEALSQGLPVSSTDVERTDALLLRALVLVDTPDSKRSAALHSVRAAP